LSKTEFKIKEKSWLAKLAAKKLKTDSVAMVLGKTIHLHNIKSTEFKQDERLLKHELCHVRQFKEHGYFLFIIKYLWETIKNGYYNNKYEIEARKAEEL
jgi:hypothetical protein